MPVTKYIMTNGGQMLTLSSVYQDLHLKPTSATTNLPDGERAWAYDRGVLSLSSVCNLTALWDAANARSGISSSLLTTVRQYHTEEQVADPVFQSYLAAINNATEWLWGNIENGGYGFIKCDGYIQAFQFAGIISNNNGISYRMITSGNHNDYDVPRRMVENCVICLTDIVDGRTPNIVLFLTDNNSTSTYYTEMTHDALQTPEYQYRAIYENSAGVLCADCTWEGIGLYNVFFPYRGWRIDTAYAYPDIWASYDELIGLGLFNGQEVDEEGNPYYNTGATDVNGGGGDWYGGSESNPASDMDEISSDAINSGFVTLYTPTKANIQSFNDWLWTSITDTLANQIKRLIVNPLDAILFIAQCHLLPPESVNTEEIKFCGIGSNIFANTITNQFTTFDCGHLKRKTSGGEEVSNFPADTKSFMDYQPYSKAEIYLPCIGYKEIDINDAMKSDITLKYQVDWVSGSCLAQLEFNRDSRKTGDAALNNNTLYEFQGNIYVNLPLSASDWKSFYSNMLSFGNGLASAISGNVGSGLTNMIGSVAAQQVSVQKSGSVASSYGYMGQQSIKMFLTRPVLAQPEHFGGFKGYQSNIYRKLSLCEGYVELDPDGIWTDNFNGITEEEAQLLKDICSSGFYIQ
mgnify:CR=1 FL=1